MVSLASLWAPVLLSAVLATLAGFVFWILLPFHRNDWKPLPDESAVAELLRRQGVGPGQYALPFMDPRERGSPDLVDRYERGPVGFLTLSSPGLPAMGRNMVRQLAYHAGVSVVLAYLATRIEGPGAPFLEVFRIVGTAAALAYCAAVIPSGIWFGRPWGVVWKAVLEGAVLALLTAAAFAVFWPS